MEGENITLSCNATGNPEPSISWVKNGFPINSNSRISFSQDNKQLTITNISRTDSGEYQCAARNRVGNDTSNSTVNVLCKCRTLFYFQVLLIITIFIIFISKSMSIKLQSGHCFRHVRNIYQPNADSIYFFQLNLRLQLMAIRSNRWPKAAISG